MDSIRRIEYFAIDTAHKAGEGARILGGLHGEGINLLAFSGFPSGRRAQMDFIPEDAAAFQSAAKRLGLKLKPRKTAFLVQGDERPGAIADLMARLAAAKINVTAIDAVCAGAGRYGAIFWVKPPEVAKAAKVLGVGPS